MTITLSKKEADILLSILENKSEEIGNFDMGEDESEDDISTIDTIIDKIENPQDMSRSDWEKMGFRNDWGLLR
jgi:hypothetical protein